MCVGQNLAAAPMQTNHDIISIQFIYIKSFSGLQMLYVNERQQ